MLFTSPAQHPNPYVITESPDEMDMGKRSSDRFLLAIVIVLMMFGLMAVYSSIAYFAETKSISSGSLLVGHILKVGIAFFVMMIFSKIDYRYLMRFSKIALIISWIFLVGVMIFGATVFGAKRWLSIGGFSFQPSTIAAVSLIMYVVQLIDQKQEYIKDFKRSFLPIMFWIVITCGLIGLEDFSTAGLLMVTCLILLFIGRVNLSYLFVLVVVGALGGAILINSSPERKARINNYINQIVTIQSAEFALDEGYQSQQAHIAIARGEILGVGIGKSAQRDFLPAPYNDFIFAIIAEEYGLLGATFILFMYVLILFRGIAHIARKAPDRMGMLLAVGCTLNLTLYGFVNAAVATGLFPVTGLPMPFVSYGGTSMLFSGLLVGVLLNISKSKRPHIAQL